MTDDPNFEDRVLANFAPTFVEALHAEELANEVERLRKERDAVLRHDEEAVRQLNAAEADIRAWMASCREAEAERDALKAEVKRLTLSCNGANAMLGVHKRRADRLRKELEHAKAALTGDTAEFMRDCTEAIERHRQHARTADAELEQAKAAIARVRRLCEMTIATSIRVQAINQARDTLAALDPTPDDRDEVARRITALEPTDTTGETQ